MNVQMKPRVWLYAGLGALGGLIVGGPIGAALGAAVGAGLGAVTGPQMLVPVYPTPTGQNLTPWSGDMGTMNLAVGGTFNIYLPPGADPNTLHVNELGERPILVPSPLPTVSVGGVTPTFQAVAASSGTVTLLLHWNVNGRRQDGHVRVLLEGPLASNLPPLVVAA